jgi:hypothetical protein
MPYTGTLQKEPRPHFPGYRMAATIVLAAGCVPVMAETLHIARLAAYANPEKVRIEVRKECEPEIRLPAVIQEEIIKRTAIQNAVLTNHPIVETDGLTMAVTILGLEIPHGTGFSSEKRTLRIKTVLYRNGAVVGEYDRFSEVRGTINFAQAVFRIRKACDYVDYLVSDASRNTVERFMLMKLLPEAVSKLR